MGLLLVAVLLAFVDRQIVALVVEPLRADLALSDTQIGLLQGPAFAAFYALAALPLGLLVDRHNRRNIIIAGILVWSGATALCSVAPGFWTLFLCRMGVGLGEACLVPATFSLLPDLFRPRHRDLAIGIYVVVALVGAGLAMALGGYAVAAMAANGTGMGNSHAYWRAAFLVVSLPGPLLALAFLAVREPLRKERLATGLPISGTFAFIRSRWSLLLLAGLGIATAGALVQTGLAWLPAILVREHGVGVAGAGASLGLAFGLASLAGGVGVARLPRRLSGFTNPALGAASLAAFATLPLAILFALTEGRSGIVWAGALLLAPAVTAYGLAPALVQSIVPNEFRGQLVALMKILEYSVVSLSVVAVGMISDRSSGSGGLSVAVGSVALLLSVGAIASYSAAAFRSRRSSASHKGSSQI